MMLVKFRNQVDMGQGHAMGMNYGVHCDTLKFDKGRLEMKIAVTGRVYVFRDIPSFTVEEINENSIEVKGT